MFRGSIYTLVRDDTRYSWKAGCKLNTRGYTYLVIVLAAFVWNGLEFL